MVFNETAVWPPTNLEQFGTYCVAGVLGFRIYKKKTVAVQQWRTLFGGELVLLLFIVIVILKRILVLNDTLMVLAR